MEKIRAIIVIEMMGRPVEHLRKVMIDFLKRLEAEKGIIVSEKKIHKPREVEEKDKEGFNIPGRRELFSTFAEIEIVADSALDLIRIVFVYMPSHIDVLSPEEFKLQNFDLTTIVNEIARKLHQYDAVAKNALMQNQMLAKRIMEIQQKIQEVQGANQPSISIGKKTSTKKTEGKKKSRKK